MLPWSGWLFWEKMQYLNSHNLFPLGSWNIYFSLNYSIKQILQQVMLINKVPHNQAQENNKLWSSPSWAWNSFDWSQIVFCDFLQQNNTLHFSLFWFNFSVYVLSHVWLCDPIDYSPPDSSIHASFKARILEWIAISSFKRFSQPMDQNGLMSLLHCRWILYHCPTWETISV